MRMLFAYGAADGIVAQIRAFIGILEFVVFCLFLAGRRVIFLISITG